MGEQSELTVRARDTHALEACDAAVTLLKSIGFKLACTSRKSDASYYIMPGYHGVIRVSAQRYSNSEQRNSEMPIVGKATFRSNHGPMAPLRVEEIVMQALGRYFYKRMRYEQAMGGDHDVSDGG